MPLMVNNWIIMNEIYKTYKHAAMQAGNMFIERLPTHLCNIGNWMFGMFGVEQKKPPVYAFSRGKRWWKNKGSIRTIDIRNEQMFC